MGYSAMKTASTPKDCLILVIDSHTQVCEALRFTLESWGFRVLTANSIRAAKKQMLIRNFTPDVVIVDLPIPHRAYDFSLIEDASRLLLQFNLKVPVIAITGNDNVHFQTLVVKKGWTYLLKPFPASTIFSLLMDITQWRRH